MEKIHYKCLQSIELQPLCDSPSTLSAPKVFWVSEEVLSIDDVTGGSSRASCSSGQQFRQPVQVQANSASWEAESNFVDKVTDAAATSENYLKPAILKQRFKAQEPANGSSVINRTTEKAAVAEEAKE